MQAHCGHETPPPRTPTPATLAPTALIDSDHPDVITFAREHAQGADDRERAVALFHAVRDGFRYDPYRIDLSPAACAPAACWPTATAGACPRPRC
jgi:transglutaminase-like putative cysteine protease